MSSHRRGLFGWNDPARSLLIVTTGLFGSVLTWMSLAVPSGVVEVPPLSVDANSVPEPVLGALPGLGPVLSGRIIAAREVGPFTSIDDLDRRVRGIGAAKVASIGPFLRFDPPSNFHP